MEELDITNIKDFIRTVPDYPIAGVNFYDVNSLFSSPMWNPLVKHMAKECDEAFLFPTHIVGIESIGFVIGAALAYAMGLPFTMVRKKGAKYPGQLLEETYELEYGSDTLTIQEGILGHTARVIIADDLIATGGSMIATKRLIKQTGAQVLGGVSIVNLQYLNSPEVSKSNFWTVNSLEIEK